MNSCHRLALRLKVVAMSEEPICATYSVFKPGSIKDRLVFRARRRLYEVMRSLVPLDEMRSILDVGATSDRTCKSSNYFERMIDNPERITAFSDQDASWMCDEWKGLRFVRGDARDMPFADNSFDFVFSSAVIEHVGSREQQHQFLKECVRVARKHVFITTPNRWYPLEMHSGLPLLHWLPMPWFRGILRLVGKGGLAKESNLNLLSPREFNAICNRLEVEDKEFHFLRFFGFKSNIMLHIRKAQ